MECLFAEGLNAETTVWRIDGDEFRHARALRLRLGESVLLSNGKGLCSTTRVCEVSREYMIVAIEELLPNHNELPISLHCAVGTLDDKERMEWLIEKAVELGATEITFINSRYSSQTNLKASRVYAKTIAAMKQSKRAILPSVALNIPLRDVVAHAQKQMYQCVLATEHGTVPHPVTRNTIVFIGPEGGFSSEEIELIQATREIHQWRLGASRLRAETAAIAALSYIASTTLPIRL